MNEYQERELSAGLKALADTSRHASASRRVELAVLAELARQKPAAGVRAAFWLTAAALVLFSVSGVWLAHRVAPQSPSVVRPQGFIEIPGASTLPPIESGAIVRVALPLTALPQYGLAILPDAATDSVEADLLIAQDGIPRAIRLAMDEPQFRSTP